MHANSGVYALLLGSGVSRSARIPTGWEIVLDLVRKQAALANQDPEPDPAAWYLEQFGEEPDYSKLLKQFGKTRAERNGLLREYFEPSEDEREHGVKMPTVSHRAIAKLVKLGLIRMIITTNFDRLLELALQDEGITPDVVHSPGGLEGAIPSVHSPCFIFKIHGDYRDARFRNTAKELSAYSTKYKSFLKRVLDDFGLIICGWSGDWDHALRDFILKSPNRRFSTYWLAKGTVTDAAQEIINHRRAEVIQIQDADTLFGDLLEKTEALRDLGRPDPQSISIAVATTKGYLAEPRHRIRLHDLIARETENVAHALAPEQYDVDDESPSEETFQKRLLQLEGISERLLSIMATVAFHGSHEHKALLTSAIERLSDLRQPTGKVVWLGLQLYPALLLTYAGGIAATANREFDLLAALLIDPRKTGDSIDSRKPVLARISCREIFYSNSLQKWLPTENTRTPASDYLFDQIRKLLGDYIPGETQFEEAFDIFEYLSALAYVDVVDPDPEYMSAPVGSFAWRNRWRHEESPLDEFINRGLDAGDSWPLLQAGFFRQSVTRFKEVHDRYNEWLTKVTRSWM